MERRTIMKLRQIFTINVVCATFFGLTCLFVPQWLFSLYGSELGDAGVYMTRLGGAAYLAFATLTWLARNAESKEMRLNLALALFIQDLIGVIVSIHGQITGVMNWFGWSTVFVYLFLALGYGYFRFFKPSAA
jgi:hypothetical protein